MAILKIKYGTEKKNAVILHVHTMYEIILSLNDFYIFLQCCYTYICKS